MSDSTAVLADNSVRGDMTLPSLVFAPSRADLLSVCGRGRCGVCQKLWRRVPAPARWREACLWSMFSNDWSRASPCASRLTGRSVSRSLFRVSRLYCASARSPVSPGNARCSSRALRKAPFFVSSYKTAMFPESTHTIL